MTEAVSESFLEDREFQSFLETIANRKLPCSVNGVCDSSRPFFLASVIEKIRQKAIVIVPEEKDAYALQRALSSAFEHVLVYPVRDYVFENVSSYSREFEHERLNTLKLALDGTYDIIITVPDALMQFTMPEEVLRRQTISMKLGDSIPIPELLHRLQAMGYSYTEMVEGPGQYSSRGSIVDVFTPQYREPLRIDFFGDDVDLIGFFDPLGQRTIDNAVSCEIIPCQELLPDENSFLRMETELSAMLKAEFPSEKYRGMIRQELELVQEKQRLPFADKYYPQIYDESYSLLDAVNDAQLFVFDSQRLWERAKGFYQETYGVLSRLAEVKLCRIKNGLPLMDPDGLLSYLQKKTVFIDLFASSTMGIPCRESFVVETRNLNGFGSNVQLLFDDVSSYLKNGYRILFAAPNERSVSNYLELFLTHNLWAFRYDGSLHAGAISVALLQTEANLKGFEIPSVKFAFFSDSLSQLDGIPSRRTKNTVRKAEKINSCADLSVGDLVVHVNHGIGRYAGIQNLTTAGVTRDYIKLIYADGGILYVPCDQLELVSKYIGGSDNAKLNKLGGSDWKKAKIRAKNAASDIAKDLIRLYAERRNHPGYAYPQDDDMQEEFDRSFEFQDTEGQSIATAEIKADMEKPYPMDRLLCGDVGFGKTEVALRAAFKAVFAGKQVAFLVPTTILAYQHYQTLLSRFRGYPVEIGMMSRFTTKKDQAEAVEKIRNGKLNIVVGTHRLFQKDIQFKDLGLLIVDEEQRFGVTHKEKLKELSKNVDVLTLTATPIPRTLNMALSGIRDMSILEEAPVDRVPVQTFVLEHDEDVLAEAIRRELRRGGQVFYLHNFIDSIYTKAAELAKIFPDQTIAVAHGRMDKEELSDVWQDMVEGKVDILVCTTIIETGVNLPNVNTLIIEQADRMGLAQLHQIRGRVGRSSRKAYAYLTYRKDKELNEVAEKRLEAIREFTEFGSGFKIAMRDLELRGAGNVLGSEQSGHMEAIGYDLYVKILEDAVNMEKGMEPVAEKNCTVDLKVDAYIPESYISSSKIRMEIYQKIVSVSTDAEQTDLEDELEDRFGEQPETVRNLITVSRIRHAAMDAGFTSIEQKESTVCFFHPALDPKAAMMLPHEVPLRGRVMLTMSGRMHIAIRTNPDHPVLEDAKNVLLFYTKLTNQPIDN